MRLSNRIKAPFYNFVNSLIWMTFIVGIILFLLERYKFDVLGFESFLLVIIPLFALGIYYVSGRHIFEYDSDGEALHFKNRNIVPFISKALIDEFPKYKLIKYEVVTVFFIKRLYVTISSKNNGSTMLKYEISYLNQKEVNDLKFSLNKVVKANKERRPSEKQ